jgi:hypothetical protein
VASLTRYQILRLANKPAVVIEKEARPTMTKPTRPEKKTPRKSSRQKSPRLEDVDVELGDE